MWLLFSPTCFLFEVKEELLVEDKGHTADFFHFGLRGGVPVDEVGSDGNGKLPPELLSFETWERKKTKSDKEWSKETRKKKRRRGDVNLPKQTSPIGLSGKTKGNLALNHNYKVVILG